MGIFCPNSLLERWGIWSFMGSFLLISLGMIPYRRISLLERRPHSLKVSKEGLSFFHVTKGERFFKGAHLHSISYLKGKHFYGICLHLRQQNRILLPFFSEKTFSSLKQVLDLP